MTADELVAEANGWVGVPFRHQGRSRLGTDCIGLPSCILKARGHLPHNFQHNPCYGRAPNTEEFLNEVKKYCIPLEKIEHGCMVIFRWFGAPHPSHAAIIDGPYMIHSYETSHRVVKHRYGQPWVRLTHSIWRLPGVEVP